MYVKVRNESLVRAGLTLTANQVRLQFAAPAYERTSIHFPIQCRI